MHKTLGTVTIGQSPRVDITPELSRYLGSDIRIRESGALDNLSKDEIAALAPQKGDYVLVTRLADGSSVQVAEHHITPRIRACIENHFKNGVGLVLLLCTGEFPGFESGGLLIRPQKVLFNAVASVAEGLRIGVLTPSPDQIEQSEQRWSALSDSVKVVTASPYVDADNAAQKAGEELKKWNAQLTVLDCMGYTGKTQQCIATITGAPTILARGIAARTVAELLAGL